MLDSAQWPAVGLLLLLSGHTEIGTRKCMQSQFRGEWYADHDQLTSSLPLNDEREFSLDIQRLADISIARMSFSRQPTFWLWREFIVADGYIGYYFYLQLTYLWFDLNGFPFQCIDGWTDLEWGVSLYDKLISKRYRWLVLVLFMHRICFTDVQVPDETTFGGSSCKYIEYRWIKMGHTFIAKQKFTSSISPGAGAT